MKKTLIKIAAAMILFIVALINPFGNELVCKVLYIVSYLIVGFEVLKDAIENILKGEVFDECFLMSIATIGAFIIGEFPEAVAVMLFFQVGETFQDYAVDKSKKSISDLMDIRPDSANVIRKGKEEKVHPEEVEIGEVIIVKPGEKVPLDGKIISGDSMLDTKALTGESVPVHANVGDEILSGTINQTGILKIEVAKKFGESTVSKILDLVENASEKKSKSENFITKFAKVYTPTVIVLAILLAVIPPIFIEGETFIVWVYRALSFLVVSCPCALVVSVPLSFFGGIGGASKLGILIKGSNYIETLSNAKIAVFDKTGTLTKGVFEIQEVNGKNISNDELIEIAAYAENYSNHPIALSIKKGYNKKIDESRIKEVKEIHGCGITCKFDGKEVLAGNEKLLEQKNIKFEKCEKVGTVVYVAVENEYKGYILIADEMKQDVLEMIEKLNKLGIKDKVMLTGDKKCVGEKLAEELEINEVYTELLPNEKVEKVEELLENKKKAEKLVFVGDGINDSPVLAIADVGIAMGALGADSAIEAADVVIMTDEPSKVADCISLSKKTMKIVKENIVFSILVKVIVLILIALGVGTMWKAVFADVGVTVIATVNALRALRVKTK